MCNVLYKSPDDMLYTTVHVRVGYTSVCGLLIFFLYNSVHLYGGNGEQWVICVVQHS